MSEEEKLWESPTKPWDMCSPARQSRLRTAWASGSLRWKLDPSQQLMYDAIYASHRTVKSAAERIFCLDVSRQSGKDFLMAVLAIETCMRNRRTIRIPYGCPTKDTVHELLVPTVFQIFQDCPPELQPQEIRKGTFRSTAHTLSWSWGARIVLVGLDLHPDWLRGPASEVFFLTEPAFIDDLEAVLEGVLLPQMLTMPNGWGVMASTPPVTPGHPWTQKYIPRAKTRGMYAKRTINDCPRFSDEQVKGFIEELGGMKATRVRREMFCEHILESTLAVIPEFTEARDIIVSEEAFKDPPPFRDTIVAMDPGFAHATGGIFGYPDFAKGLYMIEGDFAVQRLNSREVSHRVKAREWQLWGREPVKPESMTEIAWATEIALIRSHFYRDLPISKPVLTYSGGQLLNKTQLRWSDTDSRLIADLSSEHGLVFSPTDKDDSDTATNALRINIQGLKYRIHPRCVNLITHLEQGTWNKSKTKLAESSDGGHFDCIPALIYWNRNVVTNRTMRNPNPPVHFSHHTHFVPPGKASGSKTAQALKQLFGARGRR